MRFAIRDSVPLRSQVSPPTLEELWSQRLPAWAIGGAQSLIVSIVLPGLAKKLFPSMHSFSGLASLLVSCIMPALVIVFLDDACMAHWLSLWAQCSRKHAEKFRVTHDSDSYTEEALTHSSLCRPHTCVHRSVCVQVTLLRLQDILLSKWISSGLMVPAGALLFKRPQKDVELLQHVSLASEIALLTYGALPLLTPVLLAATLSKTLLAAMARKEGSLEAVATTGRVCVLSRMVAHIFSVILYWTFASEDELASSVFALVCLCLVYDQRDVINLCTAH